MSPAEPFINVTKMSRRNIRRNGKRRNRRFRKSGRKGNRRFGTPYQTIGTKRNCVPDRLRTTLTVANFVQYSFTTNNFSDSFSGNDLHVIHSGWTVLPVGYSEFLTFYQKYVVIGSRIKLEIVNGSSDVAITGIWMALYPSRTATVVSGTVIDAAAQPYATNGFIGSPLAANKVNMRNSMSTSRLFGYNSRVDEDFSGDAGNSPAMPWFWVFSLSGIDNDPIFPTVQVLVKIDYLVEFYDRNTIALTPALSKNPFKRDHPLEQKSDFSYFNE